MLRLYKIMQPQDIVDHWPLSNVEFVAAYQSFPSRRVVRLRSDQGDFVAKIDSAPPTQAETRRSLYVFEYLAQHHFEHAPALLRTRAGADFVDRPGQRVWILQYVDGEPPALAWHGFWRELGAAAARLNAFADYPFAFHIPVHAAIDELTALAPNYSFGERYLAVIERLDVLKHSQPHGLIHGEINSANCVRGAGGSPVLLDWDEAGSGPIVLELGYPLITVFLGEDLVFHHDAAAAFYGGYAAEKPIDEQTRRCLFEAGLFHALRYMSFANTERRWRRIRFALEHQALLMSVLP